MTDEGPQTECKLLNADTKETHDEKATFSSEPVTAYFSAYWPKSVEVPMKSKTEAKEYGKKKPTTRPAQFHRSSPIWPAQEAGGSWFFPRATHHEAAQLGKTPSVDISRTRK